MINFQRKSRAKSRHNKFDFWSGQWILRQEHEKIEIIYLKTCNYSRDDKIVIWVPNFKWDSSPVSFSLFCAKLYEYFLLEIVWGVNGMGWTLSENVLLWIMTLQDISNLSGSITM